MHENDTTTTLPRIPRYTGPKNKEEKWPSATPAYRNNFEFWAERCSSLQKQNYFEFSAERCSSLQKHDYFDFSA